MLTFVVIKLSPCFERVISLGVGLIVKSISHRILCIQIIRSKLSLSLLFLCSIRRYEFRREKLPILIFRVMFHSSDKPKHQLQRWVHLNTIVPKSQLVHQLFSCKGYALLFRWKSLPVLYFVFKVMDRISLTDSQCYSLSIQHLNKNLEILVFSSPKEKLLSLQIRL